MNRAAIHPEPAAAGRGVRLALAVLCVFVPLWLHGQTYQVFFATPREEAAIRNAIDLAQPQVWPLAVIVLDREEFRGAERIYKAPPNRGEFTHMPTRRIYLLRPALHGSNLRQLVTHALGHLETGSASEAAAEEAARRMRALELEWEQEFLPLLRRHLRDDAAAQSLARELAEIARDRQRLLPCQSQPEAGLTLSPPKGESEEKE